MKKDILARAKELEEDIRQMECALSYYKTGQWRHWGINDDARTFHFGFCKNYSHNYANTQDLPTWLNKSLMEVIEKELERCKKELEALGSEQEGNCNKTVNELHESFAPADGEEQPKMKRPKILSLFYALLMCLFYVALAIGGNILLHKIFGLYCGIDSITFSMAFSIIWVLCYLSIKED